MREILFRGKRVDNGEWVCGFASKTRQNWKRGEGTALKIVPDGEKFQTNELKLCIDYEDRGVMCSVVIVPETLGQYTGLTDKNGKKIFEGDIVEYNGSKHKVVFENRFNNARFGIVMNEYETWGFEMATPPDLMTVIGNVFDNPELPKED